MRLKNLNLRQEHNQILFYTHMNHNSMKNLYEYIQQQILEEESSKKSSLERGDIKFTIWEAPDKKVSWLKNNDAYQKIEYKYINKNQDINIDFLLGFQEDSWKLWIGRIGSCSYDDDPYKSFETKDFADAIIKCLDEVQNFLKKVEDDPQNYIQFYKNL